MKVYYSISILFCKVKDITYSGSGQKKAMGLRTHIITMKYNYNSKLAILSFLLHNVKERYNFKGEKVTSLGVLMNKFIFPNNLCKCITNTLLWLVLALAKTEIVCKYF